MMEDLKECLTTGLSRQKWRKYDKSFDAFAEAREAALIAEKKVRSRDIPRRACILRLWERRAE